jgi:thymidylate synthase (FAD)
MQFAFACSAHNSSWLRSLSTATMSAPIDAACASPAVFTTYNLPSKEVTLYDGKGYVCLVDMMPRIVPEGRSADIAIVKNARTSYGMEERTVEEDTRLINYLMRNRHTSPFESVVFQFKIACPIFVERQLVRHRTARINEQSYRYSVVTEGYFLPELRMQSATNKQGSSNSTLPPAELLEEWTHAETAVNQLFAKYEQLVKGGASREVARCILPVATMTKLMFQMDLHNLLHFLQLRIDEHSQQEMQELARGMLQLIAPFVPITMEALEKHRGFRNGQGGDT